MSADKILHLVLPITFLIWVVYGFLTGFGQWPLAVAFGLASGLVLVAIVLISRKVTVKLMDWTLVGYFVLAACATFIVRLAAFPKYGSVIIWLLYAGVAWGSILAGSPFSLQYARESTPPEHWQNPFFLRANLIISVVWGLAFVANIVLVVIALNPKDYPLLIGVLAPILTMVAASIFTTRYTKTIRAQAPQ
jgi:all-trans-retinol 13,14-reductase